MSRIRVYPYQQGSHSARDLARALGGKVLYTDNRSRYRARPSDVVVNWGHSTAPLSYRGRQPGQLLNSPSLVAVASNKLKFFQECSIFEGGNLFEMLVPWTTEHDEANQWLADGHKVVVRHCLTGRGGQGIELIEHENLPHAPLYTRYIKKSAEYRIHVARTGHQGVERNYIFDEQMKRKRHECDHDTEVNWQIRNHANGWVFCRDDINVPECVAEAAKNVIHYLGLDFGAVDVVYNAHHDRAYVLEVNTAPGLEGTTLDTYTNMLRARARL